MSGRRFLRGWFACRFYCTFSCVCECLKCLFEGSGCPLLFILMSLYPQSPFVYFLCWFLCAVEVGKYLLCSCGCINRCASDAGINVILPSFHPLLFSVRGKLKSFIKCKVKEGVSIFVAGLVFFAI